MLKVALGYFIAANLFVSLVILAAFGVNYCIGSKGIAPERESFRNFCIGCHFFLMILVPIVVIIASCYINGKWRRMVEEDSLSSGEPKISLRSIYALGGIALGTFFVMLKILLLNGMPWDFFCIVPPGILIFGVSLFFLALGISKDEKAFAKTPPRLPNLLQILTGEEKTPRGFRNRINFWGDITGVGWGLFIIHYALFGHYFRHRFDYDIELFGISFGRGFYLMLSLILLVYFLYAIFFAGIPRKRYWGMIFLGASALIIDFSIHILNYRSFMQVHDQERWMIYGLSAWHIICFTLLGVAGLWTFRRKRVHG